MKFWKMTALVMMLGVALLALSAGAGQRGYTAPAMDSSLVPNRDAALTKLTLSDDADHTLDLSGLSFVPLILQVRADGNFHQGSAAPVQANDLWFDAGQVISIPVNGATSWHFMRASGAGTVTVYVKALGSN